MNKSAIQAPYHTSASESADQIPEDHSEAETLPQICGDTPCVPDGRHTHIESADLTVQTTPDGIAAFMQHAYQPDGMYRG